MFKSWLGNSKQEEGSREEKEYARDLLGGVQQVPAPRVLLKFQESIGEKLDEDSPALAVGGFLNAIWKGFSDPVRERAGKFLKILDWLHSSDKTLYRDLLDVLLDASNFDFSKGITQDRYCCLITLLLVACNNNDLKSLRPINVLHFYQGVQSLAQEGGFKIERDPDPIFTLFGTSKVLVFLREQYAASKVARQVVVRANEAAKLIEKGGKKGRAPKNAEDLEYIQEIITALQSAYDEEGASEFQKAEYLDEMLGYWRLYFSRLIHPDQAAGRNASREEEAKGHHAQQEAGEEGDHIVVRRDPFAQMRDRRLVDGETGEKAAVLLASILAWIGKDWVEGKRRKKMDFLEKLKIPKTYSRIQFVFSKKLDWSLYQLLEPVHVSQLWEIQRIAGFMGQADETRYNFLSALLRLFSTLQGLTIDSQSLGWLSKEVLPYANQLDDNHKQSLIQDILETSIGEAACDLAIAIDKSLQKSPRGKPPEEGSSDEKSLLVVLSRFPHEAVVTVLAHWYRRENNATKMKERLVENRGFLDSVCYVLDESKLARAESPEEIQQAKDALVLLSLISSELKGGLMQFEIVNSSLAPSMVYFIFASVAHGGLNPDLFERVILNCTRLQQEERSLFFDQIFKFLKDLNIDGSKHLKEYPSIHHVLCDYMIKYYQKRCLDPAMKQDSSSQLNAYLLMLDPKQVSDALLSTIGRWVSILPPEVRLPSLDLEPLLALAKYFNSTLQDSKIEENWFPSFILEFAQRFGDRVDPKDMSSILEQQYQGGEADSLIVLWNQVSRQTVPDSDEIKHIASWIFPALANYLVPVCVIAEEEWVIAGEASVTEKDKTHKINMQKNMQEIFAECGRNQSFFGELISTIRKRVSVDQKQQSDQDFFATLVINACFSLVPLIGQHGDLGDMIWQQLRIAQAGSGDGLVADEDQGEHKGDNETVELVNNIFVAIAKCLKGVSSPSGKEIMQKLQILFEPGQKLEVVSTIFFELLEIDLSRLNQLLSITQYFGNQKFHAQLQSALNFLSELLLSSSLDEEFKGEASEQPAFMKLRTAFKGMSWLDVGEVEKQVKQAAESIPFRICPPGVTPSEQDIPQDQQRLLLFYIVQEGENKTLWVAGRNSSGEFQNFSLETVVRKTAKDAQFSMMHSIQTAIRGLDQDHNITDDEVRKSYASFASSCAKHLNVLQGIQELMYCSFERCFSPLFRYIDQAPGSLSGCLFRFLYSMKGGSSDDVKAAEILAACMILVIRHKHGNSFEMMQGIIPILSHVFQLSTDRQSSDPNETQDNTNLFRLFQQYQAQLLLIDDDSISGPRAERAKPLISLVRQMASIIAFSKANTLYGLMSLAQSPADGNQPWKPFDVNIIFTKLLTWQKQAIMITAHLKESGLEARAMELAKQEIKGMPDDDKDHHADDLTACLIAGYQAASQGNNTQGFIAFLGAMVAIIYDNKESEQAKTFILSLIKGLRLLTGSPCEVAVRAIMASLTLSYAKKYQGTKDLIHICCNTAEGNPRPAYFDCLDGYTIPQLQELYSILWFFSPQGLLGDFYTNSVYGPACQLIGAEIIKRGDNIGVNVAIRSTSFKATGIEELFASPFGYDLCLMPDDGNFQPHKVYLKITRGSISYTVMVAGGQLVEAKLLLRINLAGSEAISEFFDTKLLPMKKFILGEIVQNGHISPFGDLDNALEIRKLLGMAFGQYAYLEYVTLNQVDKLFALIVYHHSQAPQVSAADAGVDPRLHNYEAFLQAAYKLLVPFGDISYADCYQGRKQRIEDKGLAACLDSGIVVKRLGRLAAVRGFLSEQQRELSVLVESYCGEDFDSAPGNGR